MYRALLRAGFLSLSIWQQVYASDLELARISKPYSQKDHLIFASSSWDEMAQDVNFTRAVERAMQDKLAEAISFAEKAKYPKQALLAVESLMAFNNPKRFKPEHMMLVIEEHKWIPRDMFLRKMEKSFGIWSEAKEILFWFGKHEPSTNYGKFFMLHANIKDKVVDPSKPEVYTWLSDLWTSTVFDLKTEVEILKEYKHILRAKDLIQKIDFLIWEGRVDVAEALVKLLPEGKQSTYKATISFARNKKGRVAESNEFIKYNKLLESVKESKVGAKDVLSKISKESRHQNKWWKVRNLAFREALSKKEYGLAYQIVKDHALKAGPEFVDANWYAGWVLLNFLGKADESLKYFEDMYNSSKFAGSRAKAAYWIARSYEGAGDYYKARDFYSEAAKYTASFYGQLALAKAGSHDAKSYFFTQNVEGFGALEDSQEVAKRSALLAFHLFQCGYKSLAYNIVENISGLDIAVSDVDKIAKFFIHHKLYPLAVRIGKGAADKSFVVVSGGYPYPFALPKGKLPKSCYLAIMRQESNFDIEATSHVGAKGLMQLMPETAKQIAKILGLPQNAYANDVSANIKKGMAYLDQMYEKYNSIVPAIAAYNAGPGNVGKWIEQFGDPRTFSTVEEIVDWIELIPFAETRQYVKKVIENMTIYNAMLNPESSTSDMLQILKG